MKTTVISNLDLEVSTRQIKSLKKRIKRDKQMIYNLKIMTIAFVAMSIIFMIISGIEANRYANLQNKYDEMNEQYSELKSDYVQLSIDYSSIKNQLDEEKSVSADATVNETSNPKRIVVEEETNILTASSVQYDLPGFKYNSDIPLSEDLQRYAFQKCKEYNIEYPVLLGLMRKESTFDPRAKSSTGDYGLCQINQCNHNWMREVFGANWDPMDPYDSIDASVYILDNYRRTYHCDNYHVLLMNYNIGHGNAVECFGKGIYSSKYSRAIMDYAREYGYSGDGKLNY